MFSFLVGKYPGVEWLDCVSAAHVPLHGVVKPSSLTLPRDATPAARVLCAVVSRVLVSAWYHPSGCKSVSHTVLVCISLTTNHVKNLFTGLFAYVQVNTSVERYPQFLLSSWFSWFLIVLYLLLHKAQLVKNPPAIRETTVGLLGSRRSPGEATGCPLQHSWASLVAQLAKSLPSVQETWVPSLGWEDPMEKGMATHSSILAWRIPWNGVAMSQTRLSDFHYMLRCKSFYHTCSLQIFSPNLQFACSFSKLCKMKNTSF